MANNSVKPFKDGENEFVKIANFTIPVNGKEKVVVYGKEYLIDRKSNEKVVEEKEQPKKDIKVKKESK